MVGQLPKVSVVMPVFNGEAYVGEAIESILTQTFTDLELIIINDGSTDNTTKILESYSYDSRIKILTNSINSGLTYTRNKGISSCTGSYIAMLDSDDIALPNRFVRQVQVLDENPHLALVGSNISLISSDGEYLSSQFYKAEPEFIPIILLYQNYFAQSSVMIRRNCLPDTLYRESFPLAEDYDLWVRLASKFKVANLQETLVKYRIHSNNISITKALLHREAIRAILRYQLESLEIFATEEELELHTSIGLVEVPKEKKFVLKTERWLQKLLEANKQLGVYNNDRFEIVATKKWYEVCKSSQLGIWALLKFMHSPIVRRVNLTYMIKAKLTGKLF